jgi:hypothetical protein
MTRKNFKKSSSERLKESRRSISKYSVQNLVPGESTLGHESGFRGQINLYWKKRNAENLRYQNMLKEKNNESSKS